jgi:two-component system alkaline phosphatase synthesis response regulator PhoP
MQMSSEKFRVLVVDDEPDIVEFLSYNLLKEGYAVFTATNGQEALDSVAKNNPDLVLLDIMMPVMDGVEACRSIRSNPMYNHIIVSFITARTEDYSQIAGFNVGADDYIMKPIKPRVLLSRVAALLRRRSMNSEQKNQDVQNDNLIKYGNLEIDKERFEVKKNGELLVFVKKEFEIVLLLISKPGKVFSREEIFKKVWGDDVIVGNRTIDVHVSKIREKLGDEYIKTLKGVGYKLEFE